MREVKTRSGAPPVKEIRKTENPLPRAEAAGCRLQLPGSRQPPVRAKPGRDRKKFRKNHKNRFFGLPGPK